jgi:isopenicillin N synthase-like dioxygenase
MTASSRPAEYRDVRTANLNTIKFDNLFDKDEAELKRLIQSCDNEGFFYLDLQSAASQKFWVDLYNIDRTTKEWFQQPVEKKLETPTVSLAHG